MMISSDNYRVIREEIYSHMLKTRGSKYKWFLKGLKSFRYLMGSARGEFLESYYTLMRYVDDVVDGDIELPFRYRTREQFVTEKIEFSQYPNDPKDNVDHLMTYCFELADSFGENFSEETINILSSMLFDAKRIGKRQIFSEGELFHHFHLLDVRGTIKAALKVFEENSEKYNLLKPLGLATRIYYNLRDFHEDIRAGFVNIPKEDFDRFKIFPNDLENKTSPNVRKWFNDKSRRGINLLSEHKKRISNGDLGLLVRMTLPLVYERPARIYFRKYFR